MKRVNLERIERLKKEYEDNKENINKIKKFMENNKELLNTKVSINERSFQIFNDEKFIRNNNMNKLLKFCNLNISDLNFYETPEPFIYYVSKNKTKSALIIENKDTFVTFSKILEEEGHIFGYYFKAIIYGEGRKIQKSFLDIKNEKYYKDILDIDIFYYFGDIDSSGIKILDNLMFSLIKNPLEKNISLFPFKEAYSFLLKNKDKARIKNNNDSNIKRFNINCLNLDNNESLNVFNLCVGNKIIPQELLNYEELINLNKFYE